MQPIRAVVLLAVLFGGGAVLAAAAVDPGYGPPPPLAPGQAPPLPKAGPLAAPRAQQQVGFPAALTAAAIPPASPLTPAVVSLGQTLFFDARLSGDGTVSCASCHDPVRAFTDNDFQNIGIIHHRVVPLARQAQRDLAQGHLKGIDQAAIASDMSVLGRFLLTHKDDDVASFKTPGLRNVMVTAPYFHDGSQETLWDVVDHYNKGDGLNNPWIDTDIQPLALTEPEIDDLVAFLASLTSPQYKEQADREYARQFALSKVSRPQQ